MRRRPTVPLQLFPFLSVLLCTLGGLSVLLLVLTEQARKDKVSKDTTREHVNPKIVTANNPSSRRDDTLVILKQEIWHLQRAIEDLEAEIASYQAQLERVRKLSDGTHAALITQRLQLQKLSVEWKQLMVRNRALIERKKHLVELLESRSLARPLAPSEPEVLYKLVPHPSQRGTWRPPIVVEAANGQVWIVVTRKTIRADDDTAADRFKQGVLEAVQRLGYPGKPYILLLVRPSGFAFHYLVPRWLEDTDWDIGYELLPEDWQIDWGDIVSPTGAARAFTSKGEGGEPSQPYQTFPEVLISATTRGSRGKPLQRNGSDAARYGDASKSQELGSEKEQTSKPVPTTEAKPWWGASWSNSGARSEPAAALGIRIATLICRGEYVEWPAHGQRYSALTQRQSLESLLRELQSWQQRCAQAGVYPELRIQVEPAGIRTYYELAQRLAKTGWVWQTEWLSQSVPEQ